MKITLIPAEDLGAAAGALLAERLGAAVSRRGRASLAIPGGRSPGPVLRWLADHFDASGVTLTFVDERHLPLPPPGAPWEDLPADSNLRAAWQDWLSRAAHPPEVVALAWPGSLEDAAQQATAALAAHLPLDVALVGFGEDGHMASLFPNHVGLEGTGTIVTLRDSPKPPPARLSLSLPVLNGADHVVLLVPNAEKAEVLARAWTGGPTPALPISLLAPAHLHVVAAPAAHALLSEVLRDRSPS